MDIFRRGAIREFQFREYTDFRARVKPERDAQAGCPVRQGSLKYPPLRCSQIPRAPGCSLRPLCSGFLVIF
jgi:hypothetical protein